MSCTDKDELLTKNSIEKRLPASLAVNDSLLPLIRCQYSLYAFLVYPRRHQHPVYPQWVGRQFVAGVPFAEDRIAWRQN